MRDIKNFFTAEDFSIKAALSSGETVELHGFALEEYQIDIRDLVTIQANQLLREYIEQQPVALNWIEQNRQGFYGGCRMDDHSPQINEFCAALEYYMKKDFGPKAKLVAIEELK